MPTSPMYSYVHAHTHSLSPSGIVCQVSVHYLLSTMIVTDSGIREGQSSTNSASASYQNGNYYVIDHKGGAPSQAGQAMA